ncbi:MAG: 3-hydroxyacyl-CoA dehydrogenase NAD-binding domain-containing protein [Candidatus Thiocaldithrix dubininis]|uniref:3-hydroxyacyl-CoA dehydrogenase NAD-binding domain-containing protein n=1 Tax=Candidatus Thiocaldithrix dubininis TaxID=3080823 RepID=A0AA95H8I0_9GAMM|nr:MAG: 3-hydroxyacyl-CoA dehydrogenase NAD-binding domain-containing protein [Candidatus Thiocaldithrix dubininis]
MDIRKVAVIGAGVMGAGIAAHVTNAGIPVVLLDIVPPNASDRSVVAKTAIEKMLKTEPAPFMHPKNAKLITPGNIEDDLGLLADCDWIIEAVVERLDIKQFLYHQLESVRRPDAIVSSNTSSIRLSTLMAGMPDGFQQHFLITHFFNPPRYMRLLEIAVGEQTLPAVVERIHQFCDVKLGKGVVFTHDTPGFIANRIGIYWIQTAILEAIRLGLSVEEADAVVGRPMGIPKTGVFGLSDLVGIDIMPHLMQTMRQGLAPDDPLLDKMVLPDVISKMLQNGYNGRKGKGGFYRINREKGGKVKESINLNTGTYAPSQAAQLASVEAARKGGLPVLIAAPDKGGDYAWSVLSQTLSYAASLLPEVSDNIPAIDQAMRLGYNWKYGPFELIDQIGADNFAKRLSADGKPVPSLVEKARAQGFYRIENGEVQYLTLDGSYANLQRPAGVLLLADIKRHSQPIAKNPSASLWDIGDGVVCLEFTSKMNAMDPQIIEMLQHALSIIPQRYKALVLYNEAENFSVGANLGLVLFSANIAAWELIESMQHHGQDVYKAMKYAPFPVVGAPSGMALGGGCEILLHCAAIQAHAETYMGLVEVGVGVIPGWGGCKEMLQRWSLSLKRPGGYIAPVAKAFEIISMATVAKSAQEARDYLFLRPGDAITMNRDRLLADAKAKALSMLEHYQAPPMPEINLPGKTAKVAMQLAVNDFQLQGKVTPHDAVVADALGDTLSGGDTDMTQTLTEDELFTLERKYFMQLLRTPATLARIEHMLETGKPLRN